MYDSALVYCGLALTVVGLAGAIRPIPLLRLPTRRRALGVATSGIVLTLTGCVLPSRDSRIARRTTRLDDFLPRWQFREFHAIEVAAPPEQAYEAVKHVRANEIRFFRALTWIRRGGRPLRPGILNPGSRRPLIDVALANGFVLLAEDDRREIVIGTIVAAPRETRFTLAPGMFQSTLPAGFALAAMNFVVTPAGPGRSRVTTETRVFTNSPAARRRFATYWRLIYPGSAIIRRMWLRAVRERAEKRP